MSISSDSCASRSISRSEFLSSLPPWRRWLARLNWHQTIDAQISAIESRRESEQLKIENVRLAALESKLDSLLLSVDSSSPILPAADCN
jgi:hypothetical protein